MKSNTTKGIIFFGIILALVLTVAIISFTALNQPKEISVDKIQTELQADNIERINIVNDRIEVRFRDSAKKDVKKYDAFAFGRSNLEERFLTYNESVWNNAVDTASNELTIRLTADINSMLEDPAGNVDPVKFKEAFDLAYATAFPDIRARAIRDAQIVEIRFNDRNEGAIWNLIYPIGFLLLVGVMAVFLYRSISSQNKQTMGFGKTKTNLQTNLKIRFSDVAGAEEEKTELAEIVEFLKQPQKFVKVGAKIPRGVLLVGPPGTGKTLFAKAVAGEANVPFFSISGSDFVEMFVGVGASRVRDLFEQAKRNMPCIIFIDEIDAVGRQRGAGLGGGHDEREQTLNQLLVQMDGFETNDGIIVMAATNRADILDPALLRPGRFDRQVFINIPDVRGREAIFKVHARNKPIASDVDFQVLARITSGFTGADIANILNEAAILCARDNRTEISMNDINEGISKATLGLQKKSRVVTESDKRVVAYHEAGHAIVARLCPSCGPVHEVSIIPRGGGAGGFTQTRPDNDNNLHTVSYWKDHLAFGMGGRAAEMLVIQDITTGASGDIRSVTGIATRMVTEWGMSENKKLGQVFYGSSQEVFLGRDYGSTHNYSEVTAAEIDKEVSRLAEDAYEKALKILEKHHAQLDVMVRVLLECETIYSEEVDLIMAGESAEKVKTELNARLQKKYEKIHAAPITSTPTPTAG